jgi:hypothetical protein
MIVQQNRGTKRFVSGYGFSHIAMAILKITRRQPQCYCAIPVREHSTYSFRHR